MASSAHVTLFDALWGLNACILVHGRVETALDLSRKLVAASPGHGSERRLLALRLQALGHLLAGKVRLAIEELTVACEWYDPAVHAGLKHRYASDQLVIALVHLAWAQTIAGEVAVADLTSAKAIAAADRVRHPHTSAHALSVLAARAQLLERRAEAAALATAALWLARRHQFHYWQAWSELVLGWHEGGRDRARGMSRLEAAVTAYRATGAGQALPYAMLLRAHVFLAHGDRNGALEAASSGLGIGQAHGIALYEAELLRVRAQALGAGPHRDATLRAALELSLAQDSRLFSDRIARDLASRAADSQADDVTEPRRQSSSPSHTIDIQRF